MIAQRDEGTEIYSTDVAVPLSRLAEAIDIAKEEGSKFGVFNTAMGHVGDGNWHSYIMYHPNDQHETANVHKWAHDMATRDLEMEGTVSGEHAIGLGKMDELAEEAGANTIDLMRKVKSAVDPHWLLNPGKVFSQR